MDAATEAKQLDSVTDVVKDVEIDTSKAEQALNALTAKKESDYKSASSVALKVSKEDVAFIVWELEVTEDAAERALRQASLDVGGKEGTMVEAALRILIGC